MLLTKQKQWRRSNLLKFSKQGKKVWKKVAKDLNNTITKSINHNNMKAILEFNLPDDKNEWENAMRADAMFCALFDLSQELRTMWKYQQYQTEEEYAIVETIRDKFYEILNQNNINLYQ